MYQYLKTKILQLNEYIYGEVVPVDTDYAKMDSKKIMGKKISQKLKHFDKTPQTEIGTFVYLKNS